MARRTALDGVLETIMLVTFAGCAGGLDAPFTLTVALDVPNAPVEDPLFASGSSTYVGEGHMADATYWRLGYRSPDGDTSVFRMLPSGDVEVGDFDSAPALASRLPEIQVKVLLDSSQALAAGQNAGMIPAKFQVGDQLFYWLAAEHGTPAWLLVYNGVESSSAALVDATDGRTLDHALQLDYSEAFEIAAARAAAWDPSANLQEVYGLERGAGGLTYAPFENGAQEGVLAPPDPLYVDGRAPAWAFQYAVAGADHGLVLNVLAGGLVQEAVVPVSATGPDLGAYEHGPHDLIMLFEDDLAGRAVQYRLGSIGDRPVWEIIEPSGDMMEVFRMDAASGAKICGPCRSYA